MLNEFSQICIQNDNTIYTHIHTTHTHIGKFYVTKKIHKHSGNRNK